jgi:hypothetical protein
MDDGVADIDDGVAVKDFGPFYLLYIVNVKGNCMFHGLPDSLIPVEEVETPLSARRRRKDGDLYVRVSFAELEHVSRHTASKAELLVWFSLKAAQNARGAEAWLRLSNRILQAWGVEERTRQRAIANLERAGLIEVSRGTGRKAEVRLIPIKAAVRLADDALASA